MAVRIRVNGTIICAAQAPEMLGDYYIDDTLHYILHSKLKVLRFVGKDENGADLWEFDTTGKGDVDANGKDEE